LTDIATLSNNLLNADTGAFNTYTTQITTAISTSETNVTAAVNAAKDAILQAIGTLSTNMTARLDAVDGAIADVYAAIGVDVNNPQAVNVKTMLVNAQQAIEDACTSLTDLVNNQFDDQNDYLAGEFADVNTAIDDAAEAINGAIADAVTELKNYINQNVVTKLSAAQNSLNQIAADLESDYNDIKVKIEDARSNLNTLVNNKFAEQNGYIDQEFRVYTAQVTDAIAVAEQAIKDFVTAVKTDLINKLAVVEGIANKTYAALGVSDQETVKQLIGIARNSVNSTVYTLEDELLNKSTGAFAVQTEQLQTSVSAANNNIKDVDRYLTKKLDPKVNDNGMINDVTLGIICGTFALSLLILAMVCLKRKKA
jgi:hypothetical protein